MPGLSLSIVVSLSTSRALYRLEHLLDCPSRLRPLPYQPLLILIRELELRLMPLCEKRLSHEKLIVYQVAIRFVALTVRMIRNFPRGHADLADQLRRASTSVPLNIAEAAGKNSRPDSARFFSIARGSALECGAILDICKVLQISSNEDVEEGKGQLYEIVSMLSKMCR